MNNLKSMAEKVVEKHKELTLLWNKLSPLEQASVEIPSEEEIDAVVDYNKTHNGNFQRSHIRKLLIAYKYQCAIQSKNGLNT